MLFIWPSTGSKAPMKHHFGMTLATQQLILHLMSLLLCIANCCVHTAPHEKDLYIVAATKSDVLRMLHLALTSVVLEKGSSRLRMRERISAAAAQGFWYRT